MVNVRSLLDGHEKSVVLRIAELRAELVPLERELFEIRLAKSALERAPNSSEQPKLALFRTADARQTTVEHWKNFFLQSDALSEPPYEKMTIKELIRKALVEQFKEGATAVQLLELFENAWGRKDIVRTSLSPQLSRLRSEGVLFRRGHVWHLTAAHQPKPKSAATDQ